MLVSILTVYYNRANYVIESIQSLLDQTYDNIEIIAVDDGSTDNTLELLNSFKDPRLKVITHTNRGFTKSIIEAVKQSKGEYIAIHGSGDYSYPKRIELQAELMRQNPDIGVVGCMVENINTVTGSKRLFYEVDERIPPLEQLLQNNVFTHGEVMFRRDIYDKAGGYREVFKFTQDYDLWLRMAFHTRFGLVKEVLYKRYTLADGVSASVEKRMVQQYLAELGRQCAEMRIDLGYDWIDRHGYYSMFFMSKSKRLAKKLFVLSVTAALVEKDYIKAEQLCKYSIQQSFSIQNAAFFVLIKLFLRNKLLGKTTATILNNVLKLKQTMANTTK